MNESMSSQEFRDYYEILQVHPRASLAVIKKAYRTLLLELGHHPDQGGDSEAAALLTEAYRVLSDASRRAAYDREYLRHTAAQNEGAPPNLEVGSLIVLCPGCRTKNRVRSRQALGVALCSKCGKRLARLPNPLGALRAQVAGLFKSSPVRPRGRTLGQPKFITLGIPLLLIGVSLAAGSYALSDLWGGLGDPLSAAHQLEMDGKLQEAAVKLKQAVDRDPGNARLYERLGDIYDKQGDPNAALTQYDRAHSLDPNNTYYLEREGKLYQGQGRVSEAMLCFKNALKIDPHYVPVLIALGDLEGKTQHFDEAERYYRDAQRFKPGAEVLFKLGQVHQWQGHVDAAVDAYTEALGLEPENRLGLMHLASLYLERHDFDGAIQCLVKADHLRHIDPELHSRLAELYERKGKLSSALSEWKTCKEQAGSDTALSERALKEIARLEKQSG